MTNPAGGSLLNRAFVAALTVLGIALLLTWAWALLQPLMPVLAVGMAVLVTLTVGIGWWRSRW